MIVLFLKLTGFRFSKEYRHGVSTYHRLIYKFINTVMANGLADSWSQERTEEIYKIWNRRTVVRPMRHWNEV